jgi:hypothetical protein
LVHFNKAKEADLINEKWPEPIIMKDLRTPDEQVGRPKKNSLQID